MRNRLRRTDFGLHDSLFGIIVTTQPKVYNFDGGVFGFGQEKKVLGLLNAVGHG